MGEQKRYFYHSFPRHSLGECSELVTGIDVLVSIATSGFLLTPEILDWRESRSNGSFGKLWRVSQKRCCFTELASHELAKHSSTFGSFSIEFDVQTFRELGGMPVFYLPRGSGDNIKLENLAAMLMARLGEIQGLLTLLAGLAKLLSDSDDKSQILSVTKNGQHSYTRCSLGGAEDLLQYITDDGVSVSALLNTVKGLANLFAPTEEEGDQDLNAYYREREWRFIAGVEWNSQGVDRDLTDHEKEALRGINDVFFDQVLDNPDTGERPRVELCKYFEKLDGRPLLQYAHRIIVPREAIKQAVDSLGESNEVPIVAIEDLVDD